MVITAMHFAIPAMLCLGTGFFLLDDVRKHPGNSTTRANILGTIITGVALTIVMFFQMLR